MRSTRRGFEGVLLFLARADPAAHARHRDEARRLAPEALRVRRVALEGAAAEPPPVRKSKFRGRSVSGRIDAVSTTLPRRASRRGRESSPRPSRSRIGHDVADVEPLENTSCAHISVVDLHTGFVSAFSEMSFRQDRDKRRPKKACDGYLRHSAKKEPRLRARLVRTVRGGGAKAEVPSFGFSTLVFYLGNASIHIVGKRHGKRFVCRRRLVHARVGQIVLKCNVFKTIFVRPTETLARGSSLARGGHGRP